jgi:hypothetical protein
MTLTEISKCIGKFKYQEVCHPLPVLFLSEDWKHISIVCFMLGNELDI